jgi:hypothetical protein
MPTLPDKRVPTLLDQGICFVRSSQQPLVQKTKTFSQSFQVKTRKIDNRHHIEQVSLAAVSQKLTGANQSKGLCGLEQEK